MQQFPYLGKHVLRPSRPHIGKKYLGDQPYPSFEERLALYSGPKTLAPEILNAIIQPADYQAFQAGVRKIFLAVAGKCGI